MENDFTNSSLIILIIFSIYMWTKLYKKKEMYIWEMYIWEMYIWEYIIYTYIYLYMIIYNHFLSGILH